MNNSQIYESIPESNLPHMCKEVARQTYSVPITICITGENIENILVDALEGSSNYWCGLDNTTPEWSDKPKDFPVSMWAVQLLLQGKSITLYDIEDEEETWDLTLEKLLKGIGMAISKDSASIDDIEDEPDNALQYALFDEVVYG